MHFRLTNRHLVGPRLATSVLGIMVEQLLGIQWGHTVVLLMAAKT